MKIIYKMTEKKAYSTPDVVCVKLDNEISLALESLLPEGDPTFSSTPQHLINNPYNTDMA